MRIDQSKAPYYSFLKDKNYSQLLYKPGQHLQNSELNEMQLMMLEHMRGGFDYLFTDGDILSGMEIIIDNKTATVTDGKVYVQGLVRDFKQQTVTIEELGFEKIGIKLNEEIIQSNKDTRLKDPAAGYANYGLEGADRFLQTPTLTVNDDDSTIIYLLKDGNLVNDKTNDDDNLINKLNTILARRTYDESGHYKVYGMDLSQKNQYDDEHLYLSLSAGKAYVEGWEIEKQSATTIPLERAVTTRSVASEPKTYRTNTNQYALNNYPASRVQRLTALIQVTTDLTRQGATNGSDPIPNQFNPVVDIQSIQQKTTNVTYTKGVDFSLEGNTVRWLAGGKQPELGQIYTITFTYNKKMVEDTDYKMTTADNRYFIEFLNGDKPVDGSQFLIDYEFYLHYIASITLDKTGMVRVVKGQPDTADKVAPPNITDQSVLLLGTVQVQPMNDILIIRNSNSIRMSMEALIRLAEDYEYTKLNVAITNLDKEAIEGEQATDLKGILTDGFLGFTKSDLNHKEYNASINIVDNYLTMGYKSNEHPLTIDAGNTNANIYNRLVTGKSNEIEYAKQPYATDSHLINPYTSFPERPSVKITPEVDNWIDNKNVTIQRDGGTVVQTQNIAPQIISSTEERRGGDRRETGRTSYGDTRTVRTENTTRTTSSTQVLDSAIEFMRQIEIKVVAKNLAPSDDKVTVLFNDIPVTVKPESSKYANSKGEI